MSIYKQLAVHQQAERWRFQDCLKELHTWAERFDFQFKLQIPQIVIAVGHLRRMRLGQFRYGHNDFGLRGEVIISESHVHKNLSPENWWRVLGTLLHELIHGWQQAHGKPGKNNYHNKQFRRKAADFGLIVDSRGYTQYDPGSPFLGLLAKHGVRIPTLPSPTFELPKNRDGNSKLKLWVCGCRPPVRARVAIPDFKAECLICHCEFELASLF